MTIEYQYLWEKLCLYCVLLTEINCNDYYSVTKCGVAITESLCREDCSYLVPQGRDRAPMYCSHTNEAQFNLQRMQPIIYERYYFPMSNISSLVEQQGCEKEDTVDRYTDGLQNSDQQCAAH